MTIEFETFLVILVIVTPLHLSPDAKQEPYQDPNHYYILSRHLVARPGRRGSNSYCYGRGSLYSLLVPVLSHNDSRVLVWFKH